MTDTRKLVSTATATMHATERAPQPLTDGVTRLPATSLRHFYEEHVDGLYAFVMCRVRGDASLAEDVVQDTFLEALRRLDAYDPDRGSPRAWLWTLSRNVLRRHLRHHPRPRDLGAAQRELAATWAELQSALGGTRASDELLERRETRELVSAAIANLTADHRHVLERKYVDGQTLAELARELKISSEAVKSLLARARRAFRKTFLALCETAATSPPPATREHATRKAEP